MSTGFLLVETQPGREADVLALLGKVSSVTSRNLLYPANIAVKLEGAPDAIPLLAGELEHLEGVVRARLYRARNA